MQIGPHDLADVIAEGEKIFNNTPKEKIGDATTFTVLAVLYEDGTSFGYKVPFKRQADGNFKCQQDQIVNSTS